MSEFYLMHKDIKVAKINIDNLGYHILDIYNDKHMPIGMRNRYNIDKAFKEWNKCRCIPKQRPNSEKLCDKIGSGSISRIAIENLACSLTDCYWFKSDETMDLTWKDVNFFENGFNSNIGRILFYDDFNCEINSLRSPDLTTNGCSPKMWIQDEDGIFYLVKGSHIKHNNVIIPEEAVAEVFAYNLAKQYNFNCVPYHFTKGEDGKTYIVTPSFIKDDSQEFIPFQDYYDEMPGKSKLDLYNVFCDKGFKEDIDKIIFLDYMIGNTDRHLGNIGVIRNPDTLEIIGLAPIFDNGGSMQYNYEFKIASDKDSKLIYRSAKENFDVVKDFSWFNNFDVNYMDIFRLYENIAKEHIPDEIRVEIRSALGKRLEDIKSTIEKSRENNKTNRGDEYEI